MTEQHRTRHLWMWLALAPVIIAVVVLAVLYRQTPTVDVRSTSSERPTTGHHHAPRSATVATRTGLAP